MSKLEKLEKLIEKGEEAINQKKYGRAINNFTYALEFDKNNFSIYSKRCFSYLQNLQFEEVIKDSNKMIKINPKDSLVNFKKKINKKVIRLQSNCIEKFKKISTIKREYKNWFKNESG